MYFTSQGLRACQALLSRLLARALLCTLSSLCEPCLPPCNGHWHSQCVQLGGTTGACVNSRLPSGGDEDLLTKP